MFDFIINPLKWVVEQFHTFTGSYALAIIMFTLIMRVIILPLDIKQRRTMRKMQLLQPRIDAINERYANDPEKRSQKTMELYKKEKASPFSSCLPLLIQFPILILMVSVMNRVSYDAIMTMFLDVYNGSTASPVLESFLWVRNIFQPDNLTASIIPDLDTVLRTISRAKGSAIITEENIALLTQYYEQLIGPAITANAGFVNGWGVLPVLSGALYFLQTKLTPQAQAADPSKANQSKMMNYMMPLISVFFCWSYSAAFALYWVVSSIIAIAQTLIINAYYKKKESKDAEGVQIS